MQGGQQLEHEVEATGFEAPETWWRRGRGGTVEVETMDVAHHNIGTD